jgi:hypothetical protein
MRNRLKCVFKIIGVAVVVTAALFVYLLTRVFVSEPAQIPTTKLTIMKFLVRVKEYRKNTDQWPVAKTNACIKLISSIIDTEIAPKFLEILPYRVWDADSWGTPFLALVYDDCFIVISAGEDEMYHTSDDIVGRFLSEGKNTLRDADDIAIDGPGSETMVVGKERQQEIGRNKTGGLIF